MSITNPQPDERFRDKNNEYVYEVQDVSDEYVTISRPNYDVNRQIPRDIFEKAYTKVNE